MVRLIEPAGFLQPVFLRQCDENESLPNQVSRSDLPLMVVPRRCLQNPKLTLYPFWQCSEMEISGFSGMVEFGSRKQRRAALSRIGRCNGAGNFHLGPVLKRYQPQEVSIFEITIAFQVPLSQVARQRPCVIRSLL